MSTKALTLSNPNIWKFGYKGKNARVLNLRFTIKEMPEHETVLYEPDERFSKGELENHI